MANIIKTLKEIISIIGYILIVIVALIIIYQTFQAVRGGTWETENIMIGALGIILSGLFIIVGFLINQSRLIGRMEERTYALGESLTRLGQDFKDHLREKHGKR